MKKNYENLYIEITIVSATDVLTASDGFSGGYFENELPLIPSKWN